MRMLATIQYDGSNYHGWQVQNNAVTVQQTVQDAMQSIFGYRPNATGCSRTDSGVHALKFCYHFDYDGNISPKKIVSAMNAKLPHDIAMIDCKEVSPNFHARYSVKQKTYVYKIYNNEVRSPFNEKYAVHDARRLDVEIMNKAASHFVGEHDFSAFCAAGSSVEDNVRTVYSAKVERHGDEVWFVVSANGFLYNMVRIMAGTLLFVAYGKISPDEIEAIIESKSRENAGITAPAHGLYLADVEY